MKSGKIFWGFFFILAALFIIVSQLGYIEGVSIIGVLLTIILIAIGLKSLLSLQFFGLFMSIAFICIIYDQQLGIEELTPWPILGAALLLSIGFGILIKPTWKKNLSYNKKSEKDNFTETIDTESGEVINCNTSFSSSIKYVDSKHFQKAYVNCKFGGTKIYFDNAVVDNGFAEINVDVSFGGVEMYIPKSWKVENNVHNFLSGIEEKNRNNPDGSITVKINGNISFGGITIIYI